jgi:hypothetical protein
MASGLSRFPVWLLALLLASCNEEIDLIVPGDPEPVVYCLLDPASPVQYVRVSQTYAIYADEPFRKPSQEEILIHDPVEIYLAAELEGQRQELYYAERIDSIPKDTGWFPSSQHPLYAIRCKLQPGTRYSLYVWFPVSRRMVHGETLCLGSGLRVIDPELVPGREATLISGIDFTVRVRTVLYGRIFQSTMTFRYAELEGGVTRIRELHLPQPFFYQHDTTINLVEQRISGDRFLIDLSRKLQPNPAVRRIPLGLDFHISCGGDDLALKIMAENNTQSFSILDVNSFDNAYGVFSCLTHCFVRDVPLSTFTIDTLAMGSMTRNLGFLTSKQIDSLRYELF